MQNTISKTLRSLHWPSEEIEVWKWNEQHTDFSMCASYDTPLHGPYRADLMPFWKEVVETSRDDTVSETWVVACSRGGKTENILLGIIRYNVGHKPCPTLYITGDQEAAESFMEKRIKLGLQCNDITKQKYLNSEVGSHQHSITLPDMELRVTWPRNKMAFKQDGWATVLADEVSLWPEYKPDQMRKRLDTYPFGHLICVGSLEPNNQKPIDKDPLWAEFLQTDMRYWFMRDPKTGNLFRYEMGRNSTAYGLKWDESAKKKDGSWDRNKVRASAHYITPDGTRIDEKDRLRLVQTGEWIPTKKDAPLQKRGYHANAFYMPFKTTFGQIAVAFVDAKEKGFSALKTFNYEYLASDELHLDFERITPADVTAVLERGTYHKGLIPSAQPVYVVLIADAHKAWLGWSVWAFGANDVWMIDHGTCETLDTLDGIARGPFKDLSGKSYSCHGTFIDSGYRTMEVYRYCLARSKFMPIKGDTGATTRMDALVTYSDLEKYPDSTPMPRRMKLAHIHPTEFRDELTAAIRPPKGLTLEDLPFRLWFHEDIDSPFIEQMSAKHPFFSEPNKLGKSYRYYKPVPDGAPDHYFDMGSYALAVRQMAWRDIAALGGGPVKPPKSEEKTPEPVEIKMESDPVCPHCGKWQMKRNGPMKEFTQWHCKCGYCMSRNDELTQQRERRLEAEQTELEDEDEDE